MLTVNPQHASLWARINQAREHQRMPQALLLVGPRHVGVDSFAERMAWILLCHGEEKPCLTCTSCELLKANSHPDYKRIVPEAAGGVIKIDQIRLIQEDVYQTPKCGHSQVILIEPANKMNVAAANALLKILEEPPSSVFFILVAEQCSTIPATILSRCQHLMFSDKLMDEPHYFVLGTQYPKESPRGQLVGMQSTLMDSLCDLVTGKTSPCTLAASWADHEFVDLLWFLHLVTAQAIQMQCSGQRIKTPDMASFMRFVELTDPIHLFHQLDVMTSLLRKMSHTLSMNTTLALEDLLMGY